MDPRHPEQAISRMRELMQQYDRIEQDMNKATTSAKLGQLEHEGGLVVQEICLVAPRIHEAMMQTSRQRRRELSHGIVTGQTDQIIAINEATTKEAEVVEKPVEKSKEYIEMTEVLDHFIDEGQEQVFEEMAKPKKKATRKKKTTKKVDEAE